MPYKPVWEIVEITSNEVERYHRTLLGTVDVFMLSRITDTATGAVGLANKIIFFCILTFGLVGIGYGEQNS